MLWTILLLTGLLVLILLCSRRTRRKNEPPLDKGFVPWLGHALEFRRDAAKFLARMKAKHGDIFTVCLCGRYLTVLLDPNSFDAVIRDAEFLDFSQIRRQVQKMVFGLQLPRVNHTAQRTWMEQHFGGGGLAKLNASMSGHLQELLLSDRGDRGPSRWKQDGLFDLCYGLLFRAGYLTLFERGDNADAVYTEFRKFDGLLTKVPRKSLSWGMLHIEKKKKKKVVSGTLTTPFLNLKKSICTFLKPGERKTFASSQERLLELLAPGWPSKGSGTGSWHQGYRHFLREQGTEAEMQNRASLLQLWTTQCNAGPAAFWLLGYLLTHPEAMEAVRSEVRRSASQEAGARQPAAKAPSTPVFDSALSETLRLTAAVMINREVVKDKRLRMANGREYHLRRGDRVSLFPYLCPQMDPEIHQDPQMFKYDRFLNADKTAKEQFCKGEERLKYPTLPWGAGRNACVGKEFAVAAIRRFVTLLLTHLDLEMCDPKDELPPVNPSRYGFGMLQPDGDLRVRYRLRGTPCET